MKDEGSTRFRVPRRGWYRADLAGQRCRCRSDGLGRFAAPLEQHLGKGDERSRASAAERGGTGGVAAVGGSRRAVWRGVVAAASGEAIAPAINATCSRPPLENSTQGANLRLPTPLSFPNFGDVAERYRASTSGAFTASAAFGTSGGKSPHTRAFAMTMGTLAASTTNRALTASAAFGTSGGKPHHWDLPRALTVLAYTASHESSLSC